MLPPQVFLELWSHSREHVVEVHHDVHERVDDADEGAVTAWEVFRAAPRNHRHDRVVIQVQERHLIVLLSQHEEDRVEKFRKLGNEVHVAAACFLLKVQAFLIYGLKFKFMTQFSRKSSTWKLLEKSKKKFVSCKLKVQLTLIPNSDRDVSTGWHLQL